jgi:hypothetical protein
MTRTLEQLDAAVAAIENAPAVGSIAPNYVTQDAAGRVGANFAGHIQASGIDLPAGTSATPPDDSRVRWIRQADGVVVAQLYGYSSGGFNGLIETAVADPGGSAGVSIGATRNAADGGFPAGLVVNAGPGDTAMSVTAQASPGLTRLLIDAARKSEFLQLPSQLEAVVWWGSIASYTATLGANTDTTIQPPAGDYGPLDTVLAGVISLAPRSSPDCRVSWQVVTGLPIAVVHNGATAQKFDLSYLVIGN